MILYFFLDITYMRQKILNWPAVRIPLLICLVKFILFSNNKNNNNNNNNIDNASNVHLNYLYLNKNIQPSHAEECRLAKHNFLEFFYKTHREGI
jgi:hypothetical protein